MRILGERRPPRPDLATTAVAPPHAGPVAAPESPAPDLLPAFTTPAPTASPARTRTALQAAPTNPARAAFIADQRARLVEARAALAVAIADPAVAPNMAMATFTAAIDQVLAAVEREVVSALGAPPCAYQLVGSGSYARRELAPFSDIDYAILVERKDARVDAYFTRYAERIAQLLVAIDGEDRIHACELMSPSGAGGLALVDTPAGLAASLRGQTAAMKARPERDQDYLRTTLSSTRPIFGSTSALHDEFRAAARAALGAAHPAITPDSPRSELLQRILRSLRDPFGLPDDVPGWLEGAAPAAKPKPKFVPLAPEAAIAAGQVNIKHDVMKALQIPLFALRVLYDVAATDGPGVLAELGARGLIDEGLARKLGETHDAALRMRIRNHLALGEGNDKLAELSPADQRALRRMVPVLFRLRQELETLRHGDAATFSLR